MSIVVPTFNRVHDLERALNSILVQTYSHWEVLVVDNYSSDNTDNLIKNFNDSRIKLLKIHNNGVVAASRNLGLKYAVGKYIAFLDSDDWWKPQKLEESIKYLMVGADVVYHDLFLVTKLEQKFFWRKARTRNLKSPVFKDLLVNGNALNNSSVLICRKVLDDINGLSEDRALIASEDYDLWLRAAKITERFVKIPHTLGYYWAGGENYWMRAKNIVSLERIIKSLESFEYVYVDEFKNLKTSSVSWLNYRKGMAYFKMGLYAEARRYLELIRWQHGTFFIKIKSIFILLLIRIHCIIN